MFKFENEIWLYGLFLIPLFIALFHLTQQWRSKAVERFGEIGRLMPSYSPRRRNLKFLLYLTAFAFICIGLANPQIGTKLEKVKRKGIDVMVAIDVSKSMMADDIQPNRLERAKQLVSKMIDKMSDDRIGIIVFAGDAFLQMPLTIDYAAAKLFLKTINTDVIPTQGTAIGEAINLAIQSFEDVEGKKHRALVVISDGENHEEGAIAMAERARDEGILIYALGIGSEAGAKIPVFSRGRKVGYKQDRNGSVVISRLNEAMLMELGQKASGQYFRISGARGETKKVLDALDNIEKRDFEDRVVTEYADQFQYFIGFALLLLLLDFFLSEKRVARRNQIDIFGEKA